MAVKKRVNKLNVDNMPIADVYSVWGTTEDEHLGKMFAVIDEENAKAKKQTRRQAGNSQSAGASVPRRVNGRKVQKYAAAKAKRRADLASHYYVKKLRTAGLVAPDMKRGKLSKAVEALLKKVNGAVLKGKKLKYGGKIVVNKKTASHIPAEELGEPVIMKE